MNSELAAEARRQLDVCNACRYCEGYCQVFPALERRRGLETHDLAQLANLCHDCRDCYYACMYSPPHEFHINPPDLFAQIRREHADELSRFGSVLLRHERPPLKSAYRSALGALVVVLVAVAAGRGFGALVASRHGATSPYAVVPYPVLVGLALVAGLAGLFGLVVQGRRSWRATGPSGLPSARDIARALHDAATLSRLGGGGAGCTYPTEIPTASRRYAHLAVEWGFLLCLSATIVAAVLQDLASSPPPYAWDSAPVLLGTIGGAGLVLGGTLLLRAKRRADPGPTDARTVMRDYGLLVGLVVLGAGGLATLLTRGTSAYGLVLALHLATVFAAFAIAPFTKFTHVVYRTLAIVRDEQEVRLERASLAAPAWSGRRQKA